MWNSFSTFYSVTGFPPPLQVVEKGFLKFLAQTPLLTQEEN